MHWRGTFGSLGYYLHSPVTPFDRIYYYWSDNEKAHLGMGVVSIKIIFRLNNKLYPSPNLRKHQLILNYTCV